jgi:hypothetical protein
LARSGAESERGEPTILLADLSLLNFFGMKKLLFVPALFVLAVALWTSACQKESTLLPNQALEAQDAAGATDRGLIPTNPCARRPVYWYELAPKKPINTTAFEDGWKWGELDKIANDCILGNTLPPNCESGGMAIFAGNPQFEISNFTDANGVVSVAAQDQIISMAFAHAYANISCESGSPKIYQIDFTIFPSGAFFGYEIQFAVRYVCCPSVDE